jgi:hypothetical protein
MTIDFEPVQRCHTGCATHLQHFTATHDGREFWGQCVRYYAADDRKIVYEVELRTSDAHGRSYQVRQSAQSDVRSQLLKAFRENVRAWADAL